LHIVIKTFITLIRGNRICYIKITRVNSNKISGVGNKSYE